MHVQENQEGTSLFCFGAGRAFQVEVLGLFGAGESVAA